VRTPDDVRFQPLRELDDSIVVDVRHLDDEIRPIELRGRVAEEEPGLAPPT